jgi:hypothetical protein
MKRLSLSIEEMERALDNCMQTVGSRCEIEPNQTLTIQFSYRGESFTVVGIGREEYCDLECLSVLGKTLIDEIEATVQVWHFPSLDSRRA